MDFRHLEVFAAIAQYKNFSKAAEHLFLSQSTISIHLKNLEKELDSRLIERSTKQVKLTAEGETFYEYAKRLIETRDNALLALNRPINSFIRLGASTIPSGYLLPPLLSEFHKSNPEIFFDIKQSDSMKIINSVAENSIELGLVGAKADIKECEFTPFCQDKLVIATPANEKYLALKKDNNCIENLMHCPIIMREEGSGTKKAADIYMHKANINPEELNIVAKLNDLEAIKKMICGGLGISITSGFAVEEMEKQGLLLTFPLNSDISRQFYLVNRKNIKPTVKKFKDFTINFFKNKVIN